jgi:peptide/nickel transport system substrate-binding protein
MGRTRGLVVVALVIAAVASFVTAAAAQDRVKTKEIVVGLGAEPRTMLGVMIVDWTTNNMLEHIYDRLLDRDSKTFKPKPMLATEWKIVNDTTWEFKLRKGVKFHNGEPFTAASVKATIDYALDPATKSHFTGAAYWGWSRKSVVDDYGALRHQAAVAEPGRQRGVHQLAHHAGQGPRSWGRPS